MLLRDDQTDWIMVYGYFKETLLISLRTYQQPARADKVIARLVARKGTGGGHPSYAGGQIPLAGKTEKQIQTIEKTLVTRFIKEVTQSGQKAEKLIKT